jgi:hypothetical protein
MRTLTTHEPSGGTACHRLCGGRSHAQDLTIRKPQRLDLDRAAAAGSADDDAVAFRDRSGARHAATC